MRTTAKMREYYIRRACPGYLPPTEAMARDLNDAVRLLRKIAKCAKERLCSECPCANEPEIDAFLREPGKKRRGR